MCIDVVSKYNLYHSPLQKTFKVSLVIHYALCLCNSLVKVSFVPYYGVSYYFHIEVIEKYCELQGICSCIAEFLEILPSHCFHNCLTFK